MALNILNAQTGVKGNKRYYSGQFQFTDGDSFGDIITSLSSVDGFNATYGVDGFTTPLSLKQSITPNVTDNTLTLTGDADSSGSFEVWGL